MQKMIKMAKFLIIAIVIVLKICTLVKIFYAFMKFKYLLIAAGYLALNTLKLWIYAKQIKSMPKVVYMQHGNQEHQYTGLVDEIVHDEWSDWRRNNNEEDIHAQSLAYDKQKPFIYGH